MWRTTSPKACANAINAEASCDFVYNNLSTLAKTIYSFGCDV
jgi:hypothetical protein